VIVECTSCHAKYKYDETRFEGKRSKKIKCAKCANVFEIQNPSFETIPASDAEGTSIRRDSPSPAQRPTSATPPVQPDSGVDTTKELRVSRDLLGAEPGTTLADLKKFSLAVISGPDAGKIFPVEKLRVVLGRAGADVVLNDSEISRKHCALEVRTDRIVLSDLGSTNGTWFEEKKLAGEAMLQNQSEFNVGASTLMLIITDKD
jgi:predicted Zn finger-like uncharacterized protein